MLDGDAPSSIELMAAENNTKVGLLQASFVHELHKDVAELIAATLKKAIKFHNAETKIIEPKFVAGESVDVW